MSTVKRILTASLGASVVAGIVHAAARAKVARLRAQPDRYSVEELSKEPTGAETFVERPDGTRLRAISAGEGFPVVLAHGYGCTLLEWNIVWDLLISAGARDRLRSAGARALDPGSDGIGAAQMAGDYWAILEHFDVRDGILVGHSMGTFLSIVFLLFQPGFAAERLRGTVLVSPTAGEITRGAPQNKLQLPLIQSGVMTRIMQSETYGPFFGLSLMGDEPSMAMIDAFNPVFLAQDHQRLLPIMIALQEESYYSRLGEIRMPLVVVCGDKDKTTPAWHSERLGSEIPGARNVWVPGKGHLLNWEAPEAIVEAIQSLRG
ncbi:MAG: alpha/beta hydrolase [Polyangiaceae bacterium]